MTDDQEVVDLFVIGAGSGGVRAARMSAQYGAKVAIAEEYRIGGTCVIRGCVPKKFLVYASAYGQGFNEARGYGWSADNIRFDWSSLIAAKDVEIDRLSGIYRRNLRNAGVQMLEERAEITGPDTVRLVQSGRVFKCGKILIATGGTPRLLGFEGEEHTITSNEAFHLAKLPGHIVINGGGYIACEFASIFAGLGARVCLIYRRDLVLRGFDDDVRTHVHNELIRQGVRVITHANIEAVKKTDNGLCVALDTGVNIDCDQVMMAIGRVPATEGLGLETAGVNTDAAGAIMVDEFGQTNVPGIFAVGDVTDRIALTPVAIREGAAFADSEFGDRRHAFDHKDVASAVFTQPPVGSVGLSEHEAREEYGEVDIYKSSFRPMRHTISGSQEQYLMKLVVRTSDQVVVGVHLVSDAAPEIIQVAAIAVKAGLTKAEWDETCAVHPTAAEELVLMREKFVPDPLEDGEAV
ncbi:MAG: glutathione-disulfide reductase [Robiginitomaculum sp.]|nr:glutathione-disulfide reductase [Robiginitomaculum sp.]MDQ7077497.1 glutathione-disulfide reductase [Robiginitomaculum sp.]